VIRSLFVAGVIALATACPSPVAAHALPERFEPGRGATVRLPLREVRIFFGGDIEPAFSTIEVTDASGRRVDKVDTRVDGRNRRLLRISLDALGPGVYRVRWQILAIDGHRNDGTYTFTVRSSE
jgi:methionine-rich copper-binding protein CopC